MGWEIRNGTLRVAEWVTDERSDGRWCDLTRAREPGDVCEPVTSSVALRPYVAAEAKRIDNWVH